MTGELMSMNRVPYQYTVVALCTLAFFSTMVARVVISPVVPDLTAAFSVSTGTLGIALSGMWAAYALTQFPSGVLADRHGERIVIMASIVVTGFASLLLAVSPTYPIFFIFAVSLGGGAGLVYSAATSLVTKESEETGRAIGIYIAGGPIAGLLAPPIAVAVGARFGWQAAIVLGAVCAVPALVLFWTLVEPTEPVQPDISLEDQLEIGVLIELITRPSIAYTMVLAIMGAFTWQATASFLPSFLEEFHGYSRTNASLLFSAYFVVHGATQPLTGTLSDHFSRDVAALITMLSGIVGYGVLIFSSSPVAIVSAVALAGLAMSWGAPLQAKFMDNLKEDEMGTGFGLVRTVYMSVGALGSVVTGQLVDIAGWAEAFGLLVVFMTVSALLLVASRLSDRLDHHNRNES